MPGKWGFGKLPLSACPRPPANRSPPDQSFEPTPPAPPCRPISKTQSQIFQLFYLLHSKAPPRLNRPRRERRPATLVCGTAVKDRSGGCAAATMCGRQTDRGRAKPLRRSGNPRLTHWFYVQQPLQCSGLASWEGLIFVEENKTEDGFDLAARARNQPPLDLVS